MSRRRTLGLVLALVATALSLGVAAPVGAAPLTTVNWSVSKPHPGDTAVRYTYAFTTATAATLTRVTFTVPSGTAGAALSVADAYGVPTGGTASLAGTTVTYDFASTPTSVGAGVKVLVAVDGFTNTATPGTYSSTVTTYDNQATPASVDSGTTNTVTFDNNTTAVTVVVARSTAFDNDTDSFTLLMDPSNPALADASRTVTLNVRTNGTGYGLAMKATTLQNGSATYSIAPATAGVATGVTPAAFPVNRWGYSVGALSGDAVGVRQGALPAGNYVGYTSGGDTVVSSSGPTNSDVVTVANRVKIDFKQVATTYTSTITYTVTPTY